MSESWESPDEELAPCVHGRAPLQRSDHALLEAARRGDVAAFGVLWERHRRPALRAARSVTSSSDPEDLVSEASVVILEAIRRGGGPRTGFRPYLYAVVRNLARRQGRTARELAVEEVPEVPTIDALEVSVGELDRSLILDAFRSLPPRWREVLWLTQVEGLPATEVAPMVGLSANATAALAYRAKEGLRRAWLQAHVAQRPREPECEWAIEHVGEHSRDGLGSRAATRMDRHLASCLECRDVALEVRQVEHQLASVLLIAALGSGGGAAWLGAGGGAAAGGGAVAATAITASGTGVTAAIVTASVAALATVGLVVMPVVQPPDAVTDTSTTSSSSLEVGHGLDALRPIPAPDGAEGADTDLGALGPFGGSPDPADVGVAGGGGLIGGAADLVDGATDTVDGALDATSAIIGGATDALTGGAVRLEPDVDLGGISDPGVSVGLGAGTDGLVGVELGVELDPESGLGLDLGLDLFGR